MGKSVLTWPEPGQVTKPASTPIPIVRLKIGSRRTVVLLGDPRPKHVHYFESVDPQTKEAKGETVPCYEPHCHLCEVPKLKKDRRWEGYAPAMILNERSRYLHQALLVFTAGALGELQRIEEDAPRRGWVLEVAKQVKQGNSYPMKVKLKERNTKQFLRVLPAEFDVTPLMEFTWGLIDKVPADFPIIEPIKWQKVKPAPTSKPLELKPEGASLLAARLVADGWGNLAALAGQGRGGEPAEASAETPPATPRPVVEASAPPPPADPMPEVEKPDIEVVESAGFPVEEFNQARNVSTGLTPPQEHDAMERTGKTVCGDYGAKMKAIKAKRKAEQEAQEKEAKRKAEPAPVSLSIEEIKKRLVLVPRPDEEQHPPGTNGKPKGGAK